MSTKLTLSVNATIVQRAKELARQRQTSLSSLVEEYLRFASASLDAPPAVSSRVQAVAESLPMPPDATYDRLQEQYLREKLLGAEDSA